MVKYPLLVLLVFMMLSSVSFAAVYDDTKLKQEYGQDLTKAPFFLRFAYTKEYNKDWANTDFDERESFLKEYEANLLKQQAQDKVDAKAAAQAEKERANEKRQEDLDERERLREEAAENKEEELEDAQRQKDFDQSLRDQQKELAQMRQESQESDK
jgi:hypothetical protein